MATRQCLSEKLAMRPDITSAADSSGLQAFHSIDRMREALGGGHLAGSLSPAALALACFDWMLHLAAAPGKRMYPSQATVQLNFSAQRSGGG